MLSDKLINHYNEQIVGAAPYVLHNLPYDITVMILESNPKGQNFNVKYGNNLFNYVRDELIKQHGSCVLKRDQFNEIVQQVRKELDEKDKKSLAVKRN